MVNGHNHKYWSLVIGHWSLVLMAVCMIQRIRSFVSGKNTVTAAATILVATTFVSNVLGLLRDRYFAQKIPTDLLDTYFAAFRLPDLLFNVMILGTVSAAFIPMFLAEQQRSQQAAWRFTHRAITLSLLVLIGLVILVWILLPSLIPSLVPDFSLEKQALTAALGRILLLQPIFFGLSYLFSGVLNAMKRFVVYAVAPLMYTASIIVATVLFADDYGVKALVWGVIVGAFLHMLVQLLTARAVGFRFILDLHFKDPAIVKLLRLMAPRALGLGAMQLMLVIFTAIASSLGAGAVAVYSFADNIQTMPTAVFGLAFISALYPTLSEAAATENQSAFSELLWRGVRYLLVILIPSGIGLILLRSEIVRLILGTGYFGWQATIATHQTLGLFAISLFAQAIGALLARSFYALHDTLTPTLHQLLGYGVSIGLAFWFAPATGLGLGVPGLALAFSLGSLLTMGLLYWTLRHRVPGLRVGEATVRPLLGKLFVGSVTLIIVVQLVKAGMAHLVDLDHVWEVLLRTAVAIITGSLSYWIVMAKLGVEEIALIGRIVRSRFVPAALSMGETNV
ncbi:murein biosynthesis integral membrane protein MurJ [Candidatus Berkelbacteria bacterium]|nr:murein biosynthesis integral membrane protein MurJ [Candidatus Berkelbacteria bacterium]